MRFLLVSFVCLTPLVAYAQDAETAALLADFDTYNQQCRDGSGDEANTWASCGARDYIGYVLSTRGYCYGKAGQAGFELDWHACQADSIRSDKPTFKD